MMTPTRAEFRRLPSLLQRVLVCLRLSEMPETKTAAWAISYERRELASARYRDNRLPARAVAR